MRFRNIVTIVVKTILSLIVLLNHDALTRRPVKNPSVRTNGLDVTELWTLGILTNVSYFPENRIHSITFLKTFYGKAYPVI